MATNTNLEQAFINQLTEIINFNLKNEQFGVSELAKEMKISRSSLYVKVKTITKKSVSRFISEVRLKKAFEMLESTSLTITEIAYEVGFSSPAYFNHCFHEHYGFPPGEVKKKLITEVIKENEMVDVSHDNPVHPSNDIKKLTDTRNKKSRNKILLMSAVVMAVVALAFIFYHAFENGSFPLHKISQKNKGLSIIVLPFKNLSDNQNNQHFADGIREDILNNLYWITSLRVVSRTSGDQFRASNLSAKEIAQKMDVRYVLEGSVRKEGEKIRISVQLIDAYSDDHLWSTYFDREKNDIFNVQDEIAFKIASKLKTTLSENEIIQIEKNPTQNPTAYDHYLQARFLLHKANSDQRSDFNKVSAMNCIQYYEKAIAEDSTFAEAYAGLANAWFNLSAWGWLPGGFPKARELCTKALEIDPECAEAHAVLGAFLIWGLRNFENGGKELKTSIQLNPNFATARQWYAQYLMITGPIEEARIQINYALELEPYFWVIQNLNSWIYYFEEKYDKALEACKLAHDYNPYFSSNQWLFVLNYAKLGNGEKMKQQLQSIAKLYSKTDDYSDDIQQAFDKNGIDGLFYWLIDVNKNNPIHVEGMNGHPFFIAWWNAILGNKEEAIYWLEKIKQEKYIPYHYFNLITTNPDFDILRDDPRFLKIVDEIGLASYQNRRAK